MQNAKLFLVTIIATLLLIAGAGWFFARSTPTTAETAVEVPEAELVPEGAHVRGATQSAQFTIVEFSDLQCPACKQVVPYVEALVNQYPDQVRLVYRHYPLNSIHPNADAAAQAAEAAALQDKFWPMHDVLFERQSDWSALKDPRPFFAALAKELGLDAEKFAADIDSQAVKDIVERDLRLAESNRLQGTPSFFLNGRNLTFEDVRDQIQTALGE
jgi:protein-disulfide isomerase